LGMKGNSTAIRW